MRGHSSKRGPVLDHSEPQAHPPSPIADDGVETEFHKMPTAITSNNTPADTESRGVYFWNPSGFDPVTYLGEPLRRRADLARFVIHKIIWSNVFKRTNED